MRNQDTPDALLAEAGRDRRDWGKSLLPTQISSHKTLSGLLVRRWRYECGHRHDTALLIPPKECPECRDLRHRRETEKLQGERVRLLNRRRAREAALMAHDYGERHLICGHCVDSIKADVSWFCEGHASIFSQRKLRGFKEGE